MNRPFPFMGTVDAASRRIGNLLRDVVTEALLYLTNRVARRQRRVTSRTRNCKAYPDAEHASFCCLQQALHVILSKAWGSGRPAQQKPSKGKTDLRAVIIARKASKRS
ncbi:hypothetical protein DPX16_21416 [Anabarilius grahami]|uniref:Uncharacterized protein n=1 Tax=Anabarilius grahami TaxID=495550 RepID=A0A3N0XUE1_ANAGA|nr:hypothetical protein DPX16_21416 [Anabarilius grahami]